MFLIKNIWGKLLFVVVCCTIVFLYPKVQVSVAEYYGNTGNGTNTISNVPTPNKLDESDPAVQLPDEGYLMGDGSGIK
ncbi:hypothetical protein [Leuconostoc pseudomesenteroides]|uniref:hypothetical protein n=1 Tax=Leuconostoc pseudomesenteroides TaxID=33968 RepID=UPI0032DE9655